MSFERVFSIRIVRVSGFLVEPIQRIQSQRATGVMSIHNLRACGSDASASAKSAGTLGSGHGAIGSSAMETESPTSALAALRRHYANYPPHTDRGTARFGRNRLFARVRSVSGSIRKVRLVLQTPQP